MCLITAEAATFGSQSKELHRNFIGSCNQSFMQKELHTPNPPQLQPIKILKYEQNNNNDGSYHFA